MPLHARLPLIGAFKSSFVFVMKGEKFGINFPPLTIIGLPFITIIIIFIHLFCICFLLLRLKLNLKVIVEDESWETSHYSFLYKQLFRFHFAFV